MTASLLLIRPKFPHNVGAAIRAASCYNAADVVFTGNRFGIEGLKRLPREERMKGYQDVTWTQLTRDEEVIRPIDTMLGWSKYQYTEPVPVAVELVPGSENLAYFDHPEHALYVFGPEDGSLPDGIRRTCHRFVTIPSNHCLNLANAIGTVLYDRTAKRGLAGLEDFPSLDGEQRGWWHSPALEEGSQ